MDLDRRVSPGPSSITRKGLPRPVRVALARAVKQAQIVQGPRNICYMTAEPTEKTIPRIGTARAS